MLLAFSIALLASAGDAWSQTTVFVGRPEIKVSEGGTERRPEAVAASAAPNLECVISEIDGNFYWASRRNTPLVRVDGEGAFVTFVAATGAGYVRVIKPEMKQAAALMGEAEAKFDYVEHVIVGLRTVTYSGRRR